jgi:hypothetical protein
MIMTSYIAQGDIVANEAAIIHSIRTGNMLSTLL